MPASRKPISEASRDTDVLDRECVGRLWQGRGRAECLAFRRARADRDGDRSERGRQATPVEGANGLAEAQGTDGVQGNDLAKIDVEGRVERGLCLVPESRELFADMSVADNLLLGTYSLRDRSTTRKSLDDVFDRFPRLKERSKQAAGTLSGGERQMLALGRALMAKPKLLVLDEPSLGLAPLIVREIFRTIASLRSLGVSVLLVEQNARAALETADYGYVLETGEIIQSGPAETLIHDPKLIAAYLGGH